MHCLFVKEQCIGVMLGGMIRAVSFCAYTTDNSSEFTFVLTQRAAAFRNGYLKGAALIVGVFRVYAERYESLG